MKWKLGYLRSALGNSEGMSPESTIRYHDPKIYFPERLYAVGKWKNARECLRFDGDAGKHCEIIMLYEAKILPVMRSRDGSACKVQVEHDGNLLEQDCCGVDTVFSKNGVMVRV